MIDVHKVYKGVVGIVAEDLIANEEAVKLS